MSRSTQPTPGIVRAQLDGHARFLIRNKVDRHQCIAQIHEITRDPVLLGQASGSALGSWQFNKSHDSDKVSRMLDAAGADPVYRDRAAAETLARLKRDQGRPGIGMPSNERQ